MRKSDGYMQVGDQEIHFDMNGKYVGTRNEQD
jgi:hypothetical protein